MSSKRVAKRERLLRKLVSRFNSAEEFDAADLKGFGAKNPSQIAHYINTNSRTRLNMGLLRSAIAKAGNWFFEVTVPVSSLNAHTHGEVAPSGYEDLSKAIVVGLRGEVLDGRHRTMLARQKGISTLPAFVPAKVVYQMFSTGSGRKFAKNLPADVERYVKEMKKDQPDKDEGYYWAVAWSRFCQYKNPNSPHCKQKSYFPGRKKKAAARGLRGMGLAKVDSSPHTFVLYDAKAMQAIIDSEDEDLFYDDFYDVIAGFLAFKDAPAHCGNVYEIERVAAKKGYGPLLYDIALSVAKRNGKDGVVSDRNQVSKRAERVWQYYYSHRKDIDTQDMPEGSSCEHRQKDRWVLNTIFSIRRPLNFQRALMIFEEQAEALVDAEIVFDPSEVFMMIREEGESFFQEMMGG